MKADELLARAEILDVLARYAHGCDRQDSELVRSTYHPDAYDDHASYKGGIDGLIDFFTLLGPKVESTSHQLGQSLFVFEGEDVAHVETYCIYRLKLKSSAPDDAVLQGLRYFDRFERRDGRWAVAERTVILDWEQASQPPTTPSGPGWARGTRGETDPAASLTAMLRAERQ
ncbi:MULTISPECIES: nuclear transport factor 2 family protein [Streptomyces]|uniref:SnoaL-like domain-containing protein n=1 Tax=Streptomyces scabiei (strain 87.22) TaxID=680198 RepID=C9ZH20_STRSW|nr:MULTISPECIES: nuclear transport factor 2 family protein [Streptomyces]MBP5868157.1 nuclear transport factor 2 family protein [Streptomyces sp. LBUM 1485]MBP5906642.1 nuclear transport factor 2 family protein [Streptomyces sp. LBUM 1478]MBP5876621.1 nuclear transport factor 2 family protein [Streptomyces sp. LBUM 1477]MBP5884375.1 nuclear transport factor 2 family protein [Streptomyces sp. LBUM 1487]MBP5892780.1 nuclear transport factor 2 family protein [Streptomyces sp. LBUM 1481]